MSAPSLIFRKEQMGAVTLCRKADTGRSFCSALKIRRSLYLTELVSSWMCCRPGSDQLPIIILSCTMRRLIDFIDSLLNVFLFLAAIFLVLISVYSLWDNYQIYHHASDRSLQVYKPTAYAADRVLQNTAENEAAEKQILPTVAPVERIPPLSEDYVFWLTVDGTLIDYPVMQGENNWEYLNKSATGDFSLSGAIFLDSASDPQLRDQFSVIYGHHMAYNAMFGSLDNYLFPDYFEYYRKGSIITPETAYALDIFAVTYADAADMKIYAPHGKTRTEMLNYLRGQAEIWVEPEPGLNIVAFSTCVSYENTSRLVVLATIRPVIDVDVMQLRPKQTAKPAVVTNTPAVVLTKNSSQESVLVSNSQVTTATAVKNQDQIPTMAPEAVSTLEIFRFSSPVDIPEFFRESK